MPTPPTYAELAENFATYADLESHFSTLADVEAYEPPAKTTDDQEADD